MADSLAARYADTAYRVRMSGGGWRVIRVGQPLPPALGEQLPHAHSPWAFLTAWNPHSHRLSTRDNRRRQRQLLHQLRSAAPHANIHAGVGVGAADASGQRWREHSLFVVDVTRELLQDLMQRYQQNAMVYGTGDSVAHLLWTQLP